MHRFMSHLDDLAGLDIVIARREETGSAPAGTGRWPQRLGALWTGKAKDEAMCCPAMPPSTQPATSSERRPHVPGLQPSDP